ncbi:hypothetical protein CKO22_00965 [Thiococcus pfennigii]|nr:hypothetical protein [Thiococcus pfennigii]
MSIGWMLTGDPQVLAALAATALLATVGRPPILRLAQHHSRRHGHGCGRGDLSVAAGSARTQALRRAIRDHVREPLERLGSAQRMRWPSEPWPRP